MRLSASILIAASALGVAAILWQKSAPRAPPAPVAEAPLTGKTRVFYPSDHSPTLRLPNGQREAIRSLLNIRSPMEFGDFAWDDHDIPPGPVWIRIDLARQIISVFRAGHEIGSAVILYGTDGKPTPTGAFHIIERAREHRSSLYDAEMPFMLRLTNDGVAIHASKVRQGSATHGCIGIPMEFASRVFDEARRGDLVLVEQGRKSTS